MKKLEYIATGGETGFSDPLLVGKTILSIEKDGVGFTKIVSTAPIYKHIQYINSTGTINFASILIAGEYILVLYQDKGDVCFPVAIQSGFTLPDAIAGFSYNASFFISGTIPASISALVKPAWMTVTLTATMVTFSGTPAISDSGNNAVNFTLTNACGTVNFSQSLNVSVLTAQFEAATYVSINRFTKVEIANLSGTPGVVVTIILDTLVNTNGGILKVNGVVATQGNTYNVTLAVSGGILNTEIDVIANPGTEIMGHFTITAVSAGIIGLSKTYQIIKLF